MQPTAMTTILGKKKKQPVESVSIRKAANGYTVSAWDGDKDLSMIAKDMDEAMMCAKEMMGEGKK